LAFVLCCGGLFATTSTARSKRAHASGCNSGSFFESEFVMPPQPITRIRPNVMVDFDPVKLSALPNLTALPMTVIAIWGAIDSILGFRSRPAGALRSAGVVTPKASNS
jgi:hypothetical protein